jgi:hypothetical protein
MRAMAIVGVLLFVTGCDSDCEEVCEAGIECRTYWVHAPYNSCDDACDLAEDYADHLGCLRQFDVYYACLVDGRRDTCLFVDPCSAEAAAYASCIAGPQ